MTRSEHPVKLSIVTTIYRSREFLPQFIDECLGALSQLGWTDFEIVCVIDGSPDDSLDYLMERRRTLPNLVIVELARNFGHHPAVLAGLNQARGELVFLIDCDLEVRPAVVIDFHRKMQEGSIDVVFGYQEARKGTLIEKHGGGFFWKVFNRISATRIPENAITERLMNRRYVDSLLSLGDKNLFLGGMMHWVGFNQVGIPAQKTQREGAATYTLFRRIGLLINAVTSFSSAPLRFLFYSGALVTVVSFAVVGVLVTRKLADPDSVVSGFTFLASLSLLNFGLTIMALGIIGIYLARIFSQTQNRPTFIVRSIHGGGERGQDADPDCETDATSVTRG
jgi:putative glycosyltransferase